MSVLVCRPEDDGIFLAKSLAKQNITSFVLPTISIENISVNINTDVFTDLIFTSKYAVKNFFSQYSPSFFSNTSIYAVGASTASLIEGFGLQCKHPLKYDSYNLLELIKTVSTSDKQFAIVAGVGGNAYLVDELSKIASCQKLEVYKRSRISEKELLKSYSKHYQNTAPDIIVVTSIDIFRSLNRIFCKILAPYDSKITVTSSKMLELVKDSGFKNIVKLELLNNDYICEVIEKIIRGNE